jgi:hypothetical protein
MHRICLAFGLTPQVRKAVNLSLVPVLLYFAYHQITPDLLLTCMLLFYFHVLFDDDYVVKKRGLQAGMLGGICYLVKSYCLPFFLAHFALINVLYYLQCPDSAKKKKIIYNYTVGMLVFVCISGVWIGLLSSKYGEFTTTTQTAHNYQGISPESPEVYYFIPPPNDTAISVWEDPYLRIKKISWTPFKSFDAFQHWIKFGIRNIEPTIKIVSGFSLAAVLLCVGYVLLGIVRPRAFFADRPFSFTLVSAVLYAGGYCLILVDERYIWIVCLLLMLMGGYLLAKLAGHAYLQNRRNLFMTVLFVFCLSFYVSPAVKLFSTIHTGREVFKVSRSLEDVLPPGARVASNGDFYTTLFICYNLRLRYFGTSESYEPGRIAAALEKYDIDYFIAWADGAQLQELTPDYFIILAERPLGNTRFAVLKREY